MVPVFTAMALFAFVAGSMFYVYRFRGKVRYESFSQYLRKGWPIFSPLNCVLYLFTQPRARRPIMDLNRFSELDQIRNHWETIREEALGVYQQRLFEHTNNPDSNAYYDIGFRTFYKYGWSKFYLTWYGTTLKSAQSLCPHTVRILNDIPSVNGAMFSVLPVGSKLTPHADPAACSLRYHLGLVTPNDDVCYINIDGTDYSWRDGEALLFDETYRHHAHNDSGDCRLILMCDVERPLWVIGRVVNLFYKSLMRLTVVPNVNGDQRGLANSIFAGVAPALADVRALKSTNPARYKFIKYAVNTTLIIVACGILLGAVMAGYHLGTTLL